MTSSRHSILLASAAVLAWSGPLRADVVTALWGNPNSFTYEISHMPDFDQRRMAVPGIPGLANNGSMFCVPTSATNVLAYIANHGFSTVPPGANNWTPGDPVDYDDITWFLGGDIGVKMSTSPTGGTSWGGWEFGMKLLVPLY